MLSRFSCVQFFATLWTVGCQAPLSMGFSRQEYWSGFLCPPPGDLPDPGIEPTSPASQADSLPLSHSEISLTDTILRKRSKQTPSVMGQAEITRYLMGCNKKSTPELPCVPAAKTLSSQCRAPGFSCWSGNQIPHVATKTLHTTMKMENATCYN